MTIISAETLDETVSRLVRGETQMIGANPEGGARYRFHRRPDVFAPPATPIGGGQARLTFVMRRMDGEPIGNGWGGTVEQHERDIYGAPNLRRQIEGSLDAGATLEESPLFGPFQPTTADRLHVWEMHADAFRTAYRTAWRSGDWPAAAAAARSFRSDLPAWMATSADDLRDSARTIARNMRGEPHPPRWHIASRLRRRRTSQGIAAHFATETRLNAEIARMRGLPGYDADDDRAVVPVEMRWTGKVRHVARTGLASPLLRLLPVVKPDGAPMARTAPIDRGDVTAIIRPRVRAGTQRRGTGHG